MSTETHALESAAGVPCAPGSVAGARRSRIGGHGRAALTLLLWAGTAIPAFAAEALADAQTSTGIAPDESVTIIVTGIRERLGDVPPERSFDEDSIAGYGRDTVEDLLGVIGAELGDDEEPVILVNGERVESIDDIAGYPPEAVRRLEILPRGSGAPVGGSPRQRVYALTLRDRLRTLALSAAWRVATEGEWSGRRGDATFTSIRGQNRLNISFRARSEDDLLESERGIVQPEPTVPYDLRGNVVPDSGTGETEIDPALSALVGFPVTVAGVPQGATNLAAFAATANRANRTDLGRFRTLRAAVDSYDLNAALSNRLAPWLRSSLNTRLSWSDSRARLGLPTATFLLPATNSSSPFSRDVGLAIFGPDPLRQQFSSFNGAANGTLSATVGRWALSLIGNYSHSESRTRTERQDFAQAGQPIPVDSARDPFAGNLGDLLLVFDDRSSSDLDNGGLLIRAVGSPLTLPAGRLRLTSSAGYTTSRIVARNVNPSGETLRRYRRDEATLLVGTEIPLASRRGDSLAAIGDLSANLEFGIVEVSDVGTHVRHNVALTWSPRDWLRILASTGSNRRPADVRLIADPVVVSQGARVFDFLTGDTVDVTQISGGNPLLRPERLESDRVTVNASPLARINLQLQAEYSRTRTDGFISGIPPASAAIQIAFPDRFVRDANGRLVQVDVRPVNFERQRQEQLRYGLNFVLPIGPARTPAARAGAEADSPEQESADGDSALPPALPGGPRPRLQFSASHTILLDNQVTIRPGLAPVDLLAGGAIGISGSPPRHIVNGNLTASDRGLGANLDAAYRSRGRIQLLTANGTGLLRFSPLTTFNLRAFVEGRRLFPDSAAMRGTRIALSVNNITNARQRVQDELGDTPLRYQPAYRDAIGRTVEIEFRKLF